MLQIGPPRSSTQQPSLVSYLDVVPLPHGPFDENPASLTTSRRHLDGVGDWEDTAVASGVREALIRLLVLSKLSPIYPQQLTLVRVHRASPYEISYSRKKQRTDYLLCCGGRGSRIWLATQLNRAPNLFSYQGNTFIKRHLASFQLLSTHDPVKWRAIIRG